MEALYTIDGETDKRKTLAMIRVLKGALSVSKSRTGEVIYRYNRHEKKALGRTMARYDRDTARSRVHADSQKRDVLRKWSLVFGRQRALCESLRGFDDMLQEALTTRHLYQLGGSHEEDEDRARKEREERERERRRREEEEEEEAAAAQKMPQMTDPRARRVGGRQTAPQGVGSRPVMVGVLPQLTAASLHSSRAESQGEERARLEKAAEEERRRKARELPRFDKQLMASYLAEQRSLHEDLLTRNALVKIKSAVQRDHAFFKYRLKTRLPDSAFTLLQSLTGDRSLSATTTATRASTRSGLSTRQSARRPSCKSSKSGAGGAGGREEEEEEEEEGVEGAARRLERVSLTARDPSPTSLPRLERAKTVHFS